MPRLPASGLADGGVTTQKIADLAVTEPKIADNAVASAKLAADAIALINAKVAKSGDTITGTLYVQGSVVGHILLVENALNDNGVATMWCNGGTTLELDNNAAGTALVTQCQYGPNPQDSVIMYNNGDSNHALYIKEYGSKSPSAHTLHIEAGTGNGDIIHLVNARAGGLSIAVEGATATDFTVSNVGDVFIAGDCSALTFTDRTPFYKGDAIAEILKIRGTNGNISHDTLPEFVKVEKVRKVYEKQDTVKERQATKIVHIPTKVETVEHVNGKHIRHMKTEIKPTTVELFDVVALYGDDGELMLDDDGNQVMHQVPVMEKYTERKNVPVGEETVTERDLGNMISMLTVAVQQISKRLDSLEAR